MHEADLVGVHEARVAHHVAAVRQIDGENRTAAVCDRAGTVVVEIFIVVGADVAAGEDALDVLEEFGVDAHDVFEVAVNGAILDHQDFAVALDDLRFDFADLLIAEDFDRHFARNDFVADLRDAFGAERVGGAGPAEFRLFLFPRFQQGLVRPFRSERSIPIDRVKGAEHAPCCVGCDSDCLLCVLDWFVHADGVFS